MEERKEEGEEMEYERTGGEAGWGQRKRGMTEENGGGRVKGEKLSGKREKK